jgi:type IV pilus assembly protein PilC
MNAPDPVPATAFLPGLAGDLFRRLADLTEGGFTPAEAVAVLKEDEESSRMSAMLDALGQDLEREPSLAQALGRHTSSFSAETVALVRAAEAQNALAGGLAMLADDHDRRRQSRSVRLVIALGWPLFLLGVLALLMMMLMIFVIPAFKEVFSSFGADLPAPTLFIIAISEIFVDYWWLIFALLVAVPFGIAWLRRRSGSGTALDAVFLKIPGVGRYLVSMLVGRLTALLAGAAAHGIPYASAIAYLQSTLGNRSLKATVAALGRDIEQGTPLPAAWRKQAALPRKIAKMVEIGERTDRVAPVLARAARVYGAEAVNTMGVFRHVLFVATYIIIAIAVGIVVIAMYLPIFKTGSVI